MTDSEPDRPDSPAAGRLSRWFLFAGDRLVVAGAVTAAIFGVVLVFGLAGVITVGKPARLLWLLNGIVNGLLTLVPIAVGVNQIVLSRELDSISDFYARVDDAVGFRRRVEETTGADVSSSRPAAFLRELFGALHDRAATLGETTDGVDPQLAADVDDYARTLAERSERMHGLLERELPMDETFLLMLDYDDTERFHRARSLRNEHADALPEPTEATLDEIQELFMQIDATRQYHKTLFVQHELSELSRMLVYTGLPAILIAGLAIFTYRDVPGLSIPRPVVVMLVGATIAATLAPLAILSTYIVRVAAIAQRTAAFGPFIPHGEHRRIRERNE